MTDAEHLEAVKRYLADHLAGAEMPMEVWLKSLERVIVLAEIGLFHAAVYVQR